MSITSKACFLLVAFLNVASVLANLQNLPHEYFVNHTLARVLISSSDDVHSLHELVDRSENKYTSLWSEPNIYSTSTLVQIASEDKVKMLQELQKKRIDFEVVHSDLARVIKSHMEEIESLQLTNAAISDGDFAINLKTYNRYTDLLTLAKHLAMKHTDIATYKSIGRSHNNLELPAIIISKSSTETKRVIVIECGIHAREFISHATCAFIVNEILANQKTYKRLVDKYDLHFLLITNPDGYEIAWTRDRMWRKNAAPSPIEKYGSEGVDLMRNFDIGFGGVGTSSNPASLTYPGAKAFSEPETRAIRDHVLNLGESLHMYFSMHSYSQVWLYPYGYQKKQAKNVKMLRSIAALGAKELAKRNGRQYRFGAVSDIMYMATGGSLDWVQDKTPCNLSFALELPDTGEYGFFLPPRNIEPVSMEILDAFRAVFENY